MAKLAKRNGARGPSPVTHLSLRLSDKLVIERVSVRTGRPMAHLLHDFAEELKVRFEEFFKEEK